MTGLFLISLTFINAEIQTLGTYQQGTCVELKQICANCTYNNISSVLYPNSTPSHGLIQMTKIGTSYNYTTCKTQLNGQYVVNGFGDPNGVVEVWTYDFYITPTGTELSTSEGILYTIFLIILVGAFVFSLFGAISLPFKNHRSDNGYIISVNDLKYVKVFLWFLSYLLLMSIFGLARGVAANFIPEIGFYKVFQWMFSFMLAFLWPLMVLTLLFSLILFFQDKKLRKGLERGDWFE